MRLYSLVFQTVDGETLATTAREFDYEIKLMSNGTQILLVGHHPDGYGWRDRFECKWVKRIKI